MASIVPAPSIHDAHSQLFDLVPLYTLPTVDLSRTIESHWFDSPRLRRFITYTTAKTPPFACYLISVTCTGVAFVVPAPLGRVVAGVGFVLGLPMILSAIAQLRWDFITLLWKTYDAWFFSFVATGTFVVIAILLHDFRALQMLTCWISFLHDVFIDANVNSPRRLWIANCFDVSTMLIVAVYTSLGLMDKTHAFDLLRYNGHVLPATAFAHDGTLTILVVMARNIARRYQAIVSSPSALVKCVGFRCRLQFTPCTRLTSSPKCRTTTSQDGYLTKMQFQRFLNSIDPHDTLLRCRAARGSSRSPRLVMALRAAFKIVGIYGFVTPFVIIGLGLASHERVRHTDVYIVWCLALVCSMFFIGTCFGCSQRTILRSIFTSFDFALITTQSTVVHLILADIYGWQGANTASLFVSWLWAVWILCWDAITPPYRTLLGLSARFPAFVGSGLVATVVAVALIIFFILPPEVVNDRVFWRGDVWGVAFEFRALSVFCSMLGTISSWSLRVIWHLWLAGENELVLLEGLVVYEGQRASYAVVGGEIISN